MTDYPQEQQDIDAAAEANWQQEQAKDEAERRLFEARQILLDPSLGFSDPEMETAYLKTLEKIDPQLRSVFLSGVEFGVKWSK